VEPSGFKQACRRLKSGRKPSELGLKLREERKAQGLAELQKLMAVMEEMRNAAH